MMPALEATKATVVDTIEMAWNLNDGLGPRAALAAALRPRDTSTHVLPPVVVRSRVPPSPAAMATAALAADTHCNVAVTPLAPAAHDVPLLAV